MSAYVTQIGKHKFVCGLFWQSLSRPREFGKEAAELSKKIDSDLMVLRKDHAMAQAGFGQSNEGLRRNMFSLGAVVSKTIAMEGANYDGRKQFAHNWLGAFKLPDGMWAYFAVRDANFLPNGDFAGTKSEVIERLHGDYGLGGWNVVIGDAELEEIGFHNFNAKRIEELIPHKKNGQIRIHKWWMLQPVKKKLAWNFYLLAVLLILVLTAGAVMAWRQYQQKKSESERAFAMAAAQTNAAGNGDKKIYLPWKDMPSSVEFIRTCINHFGYLAPGGWLLEQYACTRDSATYSWNRADSTVGLLLAQIKNAQVDLAGNTASLTVRYSIKNDDQKELQKMPWLVDQVVSHLQLINVYPRIVKLPPPMPQQGGNHGNNPAQPLDWESYSIEMNAGALSPQDLVSILGQPGVRLNKIMYKKNAWSIEGVIYAKTR